LTCFYCYPFIKRRVKKKIWIIEKEKKNYDEEKIWNLLVEAQKTSK